jgi:chromosome segregation ATPase
MHQVGERGPVPNDFETVRQVLLAYLKQDHPMDGTVELPGMAALDRIEAEVERLKEEKAFFVAATKTAEHRVDDLEAEVERLRVEKANLAEGYDILNSRFRGSQEAIERLRAERDDLFLRFTKADEDRLAVGAEVERLQVELECGEGHTIPEFHALEREVERLTAENHARFHEIERLRARVEQVQAKWEKLFDSHEYLAAKAERLRAALERIAIQPTIVNPQLIPTPKDIARDVLGEEKVP